MAWEDLLLRYAVTSLGVYTPSRGPAIGAVVPPWPSTLRIAVHAVVHVVAAVSGPVASYSLLSLAGYGYWTAGIHVQRCTAKPLWYPVIRMYDWDHRDWQYSLYVEPSSPVTVACQCQ